MVGLNSFGGKSKYFTKNYFIICILMTIIQYSYPFIWILPYEWKLYFGDTKKNTDLVLSEIDDIRNYILFIKISFCHTGWMT